MSVSSPEDHQHQSRKKRVGKACDLCRIKKAKCDGRNPCSRCMSDNKLCAFSEKKKSKEKPHPIGYLELLETRVDLLTRALLKMITMAEPHLEFIQEVMEKAKPESSLASPPNSDANLLPVSSIPINEVVSYLISDLDLLQNEPESVMRRAKSAAKMLDLNVSPQNSNASHEESHDSTKKSILDFKQDIGSEMGIQSKAGEIESMMPLARSQSALEGRSLFQKYGDSPPSRSSSTHLLFPDVTEEFSSSVTARNNFGRPFTSHSNEIPCAASFDTLEQTSLQLNLLFLNNGGVISSSPMSIATISAKLDSQNFDDNSRYSTRPMHSAKAFSSSFTKRRNDGHVHKPQALPHSRPLLPPVPRTISLQSQLYQEPDVVQQCIDLSPLDFESIMFDEPPSKVAGDGFLLKTDEISANPFMNIFR